MNDMNNIIHINDNSNGQDTNCSHKKGLDIGNDNDEPARRSDEQDLNDYSRKDNPQR